MIPVGRTLELFVAGVPLLGLRVGLRSLCRRPPRPPLRLLVKLLVGLLLPSLPPLASFCLLTRTSRADSVRVLDREPERGEIERRGDDCRLEGIGDLASAEVGCRERERPRSGDNDGMWVELMV